MLQCADFLMASPAPKNENGKNQNVYNVNNRVLPTICDEQGRNNREDDEGRCANLLLYGLVDILKLSTSSHCSIIKLPDFTMFPKLENNRPGFCLQITLNPLLLLESKYYELCL